MTHKTSRRNWFKAALASTAAAGVASGTESKPYKLGMNAAEHLATARLLPDVIKYNGFTIKWTGWKPSCLDLSLYGQWIARPDDKKTIITNDMRWGTADGVYSSFPGAVGFFNAGDQFYTGWTEGQQEAVLCDRAEPWQDKEERRLAAQRHALDRIKKFINEKI